MRVIVAKEVVSALMGTHNARKLHLLLNYACEGRHVLVFDPPSGLDDWLATIDQGSREAYVRAMQLSARSASALPADTATVLVQLTANDGWDDPLAVLSLDDALAVLSEPLGVLVENSVNDWHFLSGIMRTSERALIKRAVIQGWATPLHGGGGTLPAQLTARLENSGQGLRTFVLFDSDRRHPDELLDSWTPTGQEDRAAFNLEALSRQRIPRRYWMLQRRFIESYMPIAELSRAVSANIHPDAIDAFCRLSQPGRWYFHMKKGFDGDASVENSHRCRDLYDNVDASDRAALKGGFGRSLANHFETTSSIEFAWDIEARLEAATYIPRLLRLL